MMCRLLCWNNGTDSRSAKAAMGGNITSEEIAAKLPKDAEMVFVCVDQNKLWWIKGEETGSVDIW